MRPGLGATPDDHGATAFTVWAPEADQVEVCRGPDRVLLAGDVTGYHRGTAPWAAGTRYTYVLDGGPHLPDPASRSQPDGVHGPSQVVDLTYPWDDQNFRADPLREWVLYELHVGTFTTEGTFAGAAARLDDIVHLGATAVEIMPVAQFPGRRNWGYDGVFPFAVQHSYGGPEGLQGFVAECHRHGLAVVLDVVYNHLGPEGNVLGSFAPYFTDRYQTPWGPAVNLDGPYSDEVRSFFLANARQWFEYFHIDALRLDAVHEFIDRSARPFLAELAATAEELTHRLGRPCVLIAESADNNPLVVSPVVDHGLGMQAQWNDDFHHSVHAMLTGEQGGYYLDFGRADDVARAMNQGFVYQGQYSAFRRRRHGAPSLGVPPERFVTFVQNHDQIGNRPDGSRLSSLVSSQQLRLAAALLLLAPGIPLLFMGEEYGEQAPFAYFVDHGDPALLDAVRKGRAAEHGASRSRSVPDPGDAATFEAAVLRREDLLGKSPHKELLQLYRDLIALRRREPALHRSARENTEAHADGDVVTLVRRHEEGVIAAFFNLSDSATSNELPTEGMWEELLTHQQAPWLEQKIELAPWQCRVFRLSSPHDGAGA